MPLEATRQQPRPPARPPAGSSAGGRPPALSLSGASLRWAMGLYCSFIGGFMLVAPHQFDLPSYDALWEYGAAWAIAALAAGVALLSVAALRTRRTTRLTAHGFASLVLAALALGLASTGAWSGAVCYTVLAAGLMLPAGLRGRPPRGRSGDLLSLLVGIIASVVGAGVALAPQTFPNLLPGHRSSLPLLGLALVATGLPLCLAQLRPLPPRLLWVTHLAAGAALIAFGAVAAAPQPAWTGIAFYWGVGGAVALLPALREWSAGLDTSALRTRLALAVASATSLALVFAVAVSTAQEERLATAQAEETLSVEARSVAQNVRDYVELNGAHAVTLATLAGRLPLSSEPQRQLLEQSRQTYRDAAGLLLLGVDGKLIVSDGGAIIDEPTLRDVAGAAVEHSTPVELGFDRITGRQLLLVAAPAFTGGGKPAAVAVMAFDSRALERRITRQGSVVSLGDGYGNLLARNPRTAPGQGATAGASRLPPGWDRRALRGRPPELPRRLVAFAPVPDFTWVVAVERSSASALAGVNRGRDLAFGVLLLVLPLAVAGGILVARVITRPLGTLADAVAELAAGNPWAPLETSRITEVERLSAAFREMRDRLAERTAESERLAAELRARAEALAEGDRRKDEFLAMLAHELRNPLGAVSTAAYLLGQTSAGEPAAARSLAVIQRQAQHLSRLVDDLLDVSRITRGKVELRRVPLDLGEVVKQAVETTRHLVEARNHRLQLSLAGEAMPLLADPTRLEQVLANLIRNAVKFTPPGGSIEVEAAARDGHAVVRVRDSGIGMTGELLPRVFDLFIQGQQGLDRSTGGLGIGLTLVRRLVEMHGGQVEAASDGPGRGSEFTIRLPLVPPGPERAAARQVPIGSGIDTAG